MGASEQNQALALDRDAANDLSAPPSTGEGEQMDIHKPKPVHNWREFIGEVGIIVIGVLIALGAEQAVETLQWRHEVESGTEALRANARYLVNSAAQREALSPCLGRRLEAVAAVLDEASASGRLPAVGQLGAPARRFYVFASWNAMIASQVATHMPRQQMLDYAEISTGASDMAAMNNDEFAAWTDLYTIVGPGRRWGDAEQANARAALSRAVLAGKRMRLGAEELTSLIEESGLLSRKDIVAIRQQAGQEYAIDARRGIMCKPLAAAPSADSYGQAPSPVDMTAPFKP